MPAMCVATTLVGCGSGSSSSSAAASSVAAGVSTSAAGSADVAAATTTPPLTITVAPAITAGTVTATTETTTTASAATTIPTTIPATAPPSTTAPFTDAATDFLGEEVIGYSVQGRPIVASHRGTAGGTVILVVGVIHGNENAGLAILDELRTRPLPPNIDLWLMDAMNPDGLANDVRGNGNQVDLNRNFPHDWTAVAQLGEWEYSGTGPASEPETQAFMAFADRIRPSLTLWYHQDLYRISPSTRSDGPLRERYAHITGLPLLTVSGGTYTGVAATWVRKTVPEAMSFIVELGPTLTGPEATLHAAAVLDIATMARAIG